MDDKFISYLSLSLSTLAALFAIFGSIRARAVTENAIIRFMVGGSIAFFIGKVFFWICIFTLESGGHIEEGFFYIILAFIGFGSISFFISFTFFCARWGASGKRQSELIEITSALSALKFTQETNHKK